MPRTKEQYESIKQETRGKIQEAGLRLFLGKGLLATSVNEIAEAAGVSKGLMYHYYPSKEELFSELVGRAIQSANRFMQELLARELPPDEKIRLVSRTMLAMIAQNPETAQFFVFINRSMLTEGVPEKALAHFRQAYIVFDITEKIIWEGQQSGVCKAGDPRAMALLYWSAVNGLCANQMVLKDQFIAPGAELLDEIVLKGELRR